MSIANAFQTRTWRRSCWKKRGKTDGSHLKTGPASGRKLNFGEDSQVHRVAVTGADEVDFQEVYVTVHRSPIGNGVDLRMGRMNTLIGYEVIESPYNPNFTRSWLFGLGEPFTTTGIRAWLSNSMTGYVSLAVGGISSFTQGHRGMRIDANLSLEARPSVTHTEWTWVSI